jgi:hypothetical protein
MRAFLESFWGGGEGFASGAGPSVSGLMVADAWAPGVRRVTPPSGGLTELSEDFPTEDRSSGG